MPRPTSRRRARSTAYAGAATGPTARAGVLAVLAVLLTCLTPALVAAPGSTASAAPLVADQDALSVEIDRMPTDVPERGSIRISGTVTNASDEEWRAVNLHVFRSSSPIVDSPSLAASADIDPGADVGGRITKAGTFDTVEVLQPGQTARFRIRVPVEELGLGSPGVYWIGVHALGESDSGRDGVADGRARTFVPVVARQRKKIGVGVVVPVRANVWYDEDGRVDNVERWTRNLASGGRLRTLLDLGRRSEDAGLTWLVDPAVLSAVSRLAAGNPGRTLAPLGGRTPTTGDADADQPTDGAGETEAGAGTPGVDPETPLHPEGPAEDDLDDDAARTATLAQDWLDDFRDVVADGDLMALPYGDVDVNAAARHRPEVVAEAITRGQQVMDQLELPARSVVAPRTGLISGKALARVPEDTLVLASEAAFTLPPEAPGSTVRTKGRALALTSTAAAAGGPAPTPADHPLALRQRLVSEAALRLNAGSTAPVVLVLPDDWNPEDPAALLEGLDSRWLSLERVAGIAAADPVRVGASSLSYGPSDAEHELPEYVFSRSEDLTSAADLLDEVLAERTTTLGQFTDETLAGLSEGRRARPQDAALALSRTAAGVSELLGSIRVEAPASVNLTSASGTVGATVVNGIDQPVLVRVVAEADEGLEVAGQQEVRIAGDARHRLLLDVHASREGRHDVELVVASADGRPLGARTPLPLRSSIISERVWVVVGGGAALLFVAVLYRIVRRIRRVRAGEPVRPPLPPGSPEPGTGTADAAPSGAPLEDT